MKGLSVLFVCGLLLFAHGLKGRLRDARVLPADQRPRIDQAASPHVEGARPIRVTEKGSIQTWN